MIDDAPGTESWIAAGLTQGIGLFVRLAGVVLVIVGVWIGLKVVFEAWDLYRKPDRIEVMATAVEAGSGLDQMLAQYTEADDGADTGGAAANQPVQQAGSIRVSYFLAWGITMLLLFLVGGLCFAAVRTGADLALRDLETRKLMHEFVRELRKPERA
ncbi:MAG: hypothetical protein ACREWG_14970 [Gammaproteobacteria bacterium]